jgi:hypothetical protein
MYVDDVWFAAKAKSIEEMTDILNEDLARAQKNISNLGFSLLTPNIMTAIVFHLNNREASRKLNFTV